MSVMLTGLVDDGYMRGFGRIHTEVVRPVYAVVIVTKLADVGVGEGVVDGTTDGIVGCNEVVGCVVGCVVG
jgi:hypothetical protein